MSFLRYKKSRSGTADAPSEPPEGLSAEDWGKLKGGTLAAITDLHCGAPSAERLADVLSTNTTLVELSTHIFSSNNDSMLAAAIVKSRNPNFLYSGMDGIGGASEIILPSESPADVKRLGILAVHNHKAVTALLDKLQDPAALTLQDQVEIGRRKPAIIAIARRERNVSDEAVQNLFARVGQEEARAASFSIRADKELELALAQVPEPK